jgi:hypothetical protein
VVYLLAFMELTYKLATKLAKLNNLTIIGTKVMPCVEDAPKAISSKKRRYETDEAK